MRAPRAVQSGLREVRRRRAPLGLAALVVAYCWFVAGIRPFTVPMQLAVALPEVAMAVLVLVRRWDSHSSPRRPYGPQGMLRGAAPWIVLILLLTILELVAYAASPRRDHPTLSSMAATLIDHRPGRAFVMLAWLALGWALFLRHDPQAPTPRRP